MENTAHLSTTYGTQWYNDVVTRTNLLSRIMEVGTSKYAMSGKHLSRFMSGRSEAGTLRALLVENVQ
ncbi:MAG: hypothetical protein RR365_10465 [Bacteroides sp.]